MKNLSAALAGAAVAQLIAGSALAAGIDMNAVAGAAAQPIAIGIPANTYTMTTNADGSTVVIVTLPDGFKYVIVGDQCVVPGTPPTGCERLGFIVIFNQSAGDFSHATINAWNANRPPQLFKADDGRTMMVHYMLARDGISSGTLAQNFEFWNNAVIAINNYLSAAPKGVTVNASMAPPRPLDAILRSWFEHGRIGEDAANDSLSTPD